MWKLILEPVGLAMHEIRDEENRVVCSFFSYGKTVSERERAYKNAKLIVNAPELLDYTKKAVELLNEASHYLPEDSALYKKLKFSIDEGLRLQCK